MANAQGAERVNWKFKAAIQNLVAGLPAPLAYAAYFQLQRRLGRLRSPDPLDWLAPARQVCTLLQEQGVLPAGKTFFEIGTGWVPLMPMAYWLMGAERTITIDLNPYLRTALIRECLASIARRESEVRGLFGDLLREERFAALLALDAGGKFARDAFLDLCRIDYRSGVDAARTGLADHSVDVHCSYTVLEHIPPAGLSSVLEEGNRITRDNGLFVHRIDYTDHFSHTDPGISPIHFLRFSDEQWQRLAGNRFMYMNRLRHDDFLELFRQAGHEILHIEAHVDEALAERLARGEIELHGQFRSKPATTLATVGAWVVSRRSPAMPAPTE